MPIDCYECTGLGDDYYFDENGELVSACDKCPLDKNWLEDLKYEMLDWAEDGDEDD